jgi:hypothetical protein
MKYVLMSAEQQYITWREVKHAAGLRNCTAVTLQSPLATSAVPQDQAVYSTKYTNLHRCNPHYSRLRAKKRTMHPTVWSRGNAPDLHCGGARFEYRPRHGLS